MAEVKGAVLNSMLAFLRREFGKQAVDDAISTLSPKDQKLFPRTVLDSNWYPYAGWGPFRRLSTVLAARKPIQDFALNLGKFSAEHVFGGVYKNLLKNDPARVVGQFVWLHDFFYRDGLELQTSFPSSSSCYLQYRSSKDDKPARSTCDTILGFWIRTIELAGGTVARAEHVKCRTSGAETCDFLLEW